MENETNDIQYLRQLPYSNEAEQAVLGSVFVNAECLGTVAENLKEDEFYLPQHKSIFSAMVALYERGEPVDIVTVSTELGDNLTAIGGYNYLANLAISLPTTENLKAYIKIVKDLDASGKHDGICLQLSCITNFFDLHSLGIYFSACLQQAKIHHGCQHTYVSAKDF